MSIAEGFAVFAVDGIPEIRPGDDIVQIVGDAVEGFLVDGDILVVTSKVVSKAEGRIVPAAEKDAAIEAETVRIVAERWRAGSRTRIVEDVRGFVMANAGVDASNVEEGYVLLLPQDPDASARFMAEILRARFQLRLGVVISDTFGRPWREGQTDVAIGAAGIRVVDDLRGSADAQGRPLHVTMPAVADEIAAAADLVTGKSLGRPVAIVRGLGRLVGDLAELPGAQRLVRPAADDLFARGSAEAESDGYRRGYEDGRDDRAPSL